MKIFQSIKKYFAVSGIDLRQSNHKYSLNAKNCKALVLCAASPFFIFSYGFRVAKTFIDVINSVRTGYTHLIVFLIFTVNVFRAKKMFQFIDNLEYIIHTSESSFKVFEILAKAMGIF